MACKELQEKIAQRDDWREEIDRGKMFGVLIVEKPRKNGEATEEVKKIEGVEVKELNTPADCFMELKAGGVDAVVNDRPVNDYYIQKTGATGVKALPEKLTAEQYGIAIGKDNTELQQKINDALKKLHENGEYDKIFAKWFGEQKK